MQTLIFDRDCLAEALQDSVSAVLETMFFSSVSKIEQSCPLPATGTLLQEDSIGAHLRFSGQSKGEFAFSLDAQTLQPIALDFLGRQHPPACDQELASIVCEMGNMFCGSLLSRLESKSVFHLDAPCLDRGEASLSAPVGAVSACFSLESGQLRAWIHLQDESQSIES